MRVYISTPGKFQSAFVWARFLEERDSLAGIASTSPRGRLSHPGVPAERVHAFAPIGLATAAMRRVMPPASRPPADYALQAMFDRAVSARLPEVDVFNGWAGSALFTMHRARKRGARTVLQTGSAHIQTQTDILAEEYRRHGGGDDALAAPRLIRRHLQEYEEADRIVVPSAFVLETFRERGVSEEKLSLVPWAVPPITDGTRRTDHDGPLRVVFVAAVTLRKGVPYLLEAMREVGDTATLRLVGGRNDELIERLGGLPPNVEAVGHVRGDGLARELEQADVFVLPSVEDGSAFAIHEAMQAGLPVIVSDQAGPALIDDGRSGFIVPARDSHAIADRLRRLASDPELRAGVGAAARAVASARTAEVYGKELLENVYQPLLGDEPVVPQRAR